MSFSMRVKEEAAQIGGLARHCAIAELAAIINACGVMEAEGDFSIRTDSAFAAQRFQRLAGEHFALECGEPPDKPEGSKGIYRLTQESRGNARNLLLAAGMLDVLSGAIERRIYPLAVKSVCCKMAYIRGVFLSCGSVSDPFKAYHMEFVAGGKADSGYVRAFTELFGYFDLHPKTVLRKGGAVVYFKEGEQIADVLRVIGASVSLLEFEDCRARKNMDNDINRKSNCQSANDDKTLTASAQQVWDIRLIAETIGLDALSPPLRETAEARLENPLLSMQDLGALMRPPVGKSGLNHRLRKISAIAESLKC